MHTPLIDLSIYVSALFAPEVVALLCAFLIVIAWSIAFLRHIPIRHIFHQHVSSGIKTCFLIVGSTGIATFLSQTIKHIYKIPRPVDMLVMETGYRFPSGHATVSTAFFVALIVSMYVFYSTSALPVKRFVTSLSILLIIGVSSSRLVLHVHKPIDVICGVVLGLISVLIMVYIYKKNNTYEKIASK